MACLGKRKRGYELSDKARKLLSGKEGVAKISHRHDDVVGKTRYIGVVFARKETTTPIAENTAPFKNITRKDHPLKISPVSIGRVRIRITPPA